MIPVEELDLLRLVFCHHGEFVEVSEILHQLDVGRGFQGESIEKVKVSIALLKSEYLNHRWGDPSHKASYHLLIFGFKLVLTDRDDVYGVKSHERFMVWSQKSHSRIC